MEIKVYLQKKGKPVFAEGIYYGDRMVVLPGGMISCDFANHIRGGRVAKSYRDNPEYVDSSKRIIKAAVFSSPSTAAQFVTGRSTNGYKEWKIDKKTSLETFLKEEGLSGDTKN